MPNGRWIVGYRAACTKGGNKGQHVLLTYSDDEGASWSKPAAPFIPPVLDGKPGQFRAVSLTPMGGPNLLAVSYWLDYSDPTLPFFNEATEGLLDSRIMLSESKDNGLTWSEPSLMDTTPFSSPTPITGPVLFLPDGTMVCQFETNKPYYDTTPWVHSSVLMYSSDGGHTWPRYSVVTRGPKIFYWDQRPQVLTDGRIFDLFWPYDSHAVEYLNIHACESCDGGLTWSAIWDTGVAGQPAPAVSLRNGRLAMVYVDRTTAPAIRCRISDDGGRSWPNESTLSIYETTLDAQTTSKGDMADTWAEMRKFSVGLPATAALPNGDFIVVYHAGKIADHTDIRWARIGVTKP